MAVLVFNGNGEVRQELPPEVKALIKAARVWQEADVDEADAAITALSEAVSACKDIPCE